ncbi:MAG TPA: T9SS type A sorting domain-containing protein [Flavobacterium sp.]|jgi:uncharacterized delta-60 repeat protein
MNKITLLASLFFSFTVSAQVSLDPDFGVAGKMNENFLGFDNVMQDMVLQPDGKIIAVGSLNSAANDTQFLITRFLSNGTVDVGFGTGGVVLADAGLKAYAGAVAIQPDGKIIVAGLMLVQTPGYTFSDMMIVRCNSDGTLDASFGDGGIKIISKPFSETLNSVLIQDDKIILAGSTAPSVTDRYLSMVRIDDTGEVDTSFGINGYSEVNLPGYNELFEIGFDSQGNIIGSGRTDSQFVVAKYDSNGFLDDSFGIEGVVITSIGSNAIFHRQLILSDDSVICVGSSGPTASKNNLVIAKYDSYGMPALDFGTNGMIVTDFGTGINSMGRDISLDHDNNLVVGLSVGPPYDYDFVTAKYSQTGVLDTSFGTNGYYTTTFLGGHEYLSRLLIQPDHKILIGGSKHGFVMARLMDGPLATEDFEISQHISFAPNPIVANSKLSLNLNVTDVFTCKLYDSKGTLVKILFDNKQFNEGVNLEDFNSDNLTKGIYFIKIFGNGNLERTIKIIR